MERCSKHVAYETEKALQYDNFLSTTFFKMFLSDKGIKLPSTIPLKPLLLIYISFCNSQNPNFIEKIIEVVFKREFKYTKKGIKFNNYDERNLLEQEICKLFVCQCNNIIELLWRTPQYLSSFPRSINMLFSTL